MGTDLVISAYRDDLAWVRPLQRPAVLVHLYDKWEWPDSAASRFGRDGTAVLYQRLPNVGKLDHTFLHHVVERWDRLADWTVFSPDGPHEHLRGARIEDCLVAGDSLRVPWLHRTRDWGPDGRLRWDLFRAITDRNGTNWYDRYQSGKIARAGLSFVDWMRAHVGFDPDGPDWPGYQSGSILAVPRRAITYLPRAFYARLRDRLSHDREPEEGHYLERAWVAIFSGLAEHRE